MFLSKRANSSLTTCAATPKKLPLKYDKYKAPVIDEQACNHLKRNKSDMAKRSAAESPGPTQGSGMKTGQDMSSHCETVTVHQGLINTGSSVSQAVCGDISCSLHAEMGVQLRHDNAVI